MWYKVWVDSGTANGRREEIIEIDDNGVIISGNNK